MKTAAYFFTTILNDKKDLLSCHLLWLAQTDISKIIETQLPAVGTLYM